MNSVSGTRKDWPGKVHTIKELDRSMRRLKSSVRKLPFPDEWSRYGGWKGRKFNSTGFFRVHHDGKRWWLVDPDGYAFLSAGVDCIGDNVRRDDQRTGRSFCLASATGFA